MKLLCLLLLILVTLTGCTTSVTSNPPVGNTDGVTALQPSPSELEQQTWINPGKTTISNYFPGARAEMTLQVHNGKPVPTSMRAVYRTPTREKDGYVALDASEWVTVSDNSFVLEGYETRDLLIVLSVPKDVRIKEDKWEFWVVVGEESASQVQTELGARFLVNMR